MDEILEMILELRWPFVSISSVGIGACLLAQAEGCSRMWPKALSSCQCVLVWGQSCCKLLIDVHCLICDGLKLGDVWMKVAIRVKRFL